MTARRRSLLAHGLAWGVVVLTSLTLAYLPVWIFALVVLAGSGCYAAWQIVAYAMEV